MYRCSSEAAETQGYSINVKLCSRQVPKSLGALGTLLVSPEITIEIAVTLNVSECCKHLKVLL